MAFFRFPLSLSQVLRGQVSESSLALLEDRDRALEDYLSNETGAPAASGSSGGIIAYHEYAPADFTSEFFLHATSSVVLSDLDATKLAITFTAPASGAVLVELEGTVNHAAAGNRKVYWGVREGTTTLQQVTVMDRNAATSTLMPKHRCLLPISGLVPGSEHTYKWAASSNTSSSNLMVQRFNPSSPNNVVGPAIMAVHALP